MLRTGCVCGTKNAMVFDLENERSGYAWASHCVYIWCALDRHDADPF
jgi:hypothetical protein